MKMSIDQMVDRVAQSIQYTGGYLYPGTRWSHGLVGIVAPSKGLWRDPDVERIRQILSALPEGEEVKEYTRLAGGTEIITYRKTGDAFAIVDRWSDSDE